MTTSDLPVVIQLGRDDLPAMCQHLLRLDDIDRVQRFGQPAADFVIERYIGDLNFERDTHYGAFADHGDERRIVGLCHLALAPQGQSGEIGVSVDADFRRRGIASRLLERATLHAVNQGVSEVIMYFLPYNTGLMVLARQHGMRVSVGHGEGIARLAGREADATTVASELLATFGDMTDRSVRHMADGVLASSEAWRHALVDGVR